MTTVNLQGVYVPETSIDPERFFRLTRRLTVQAKQVAFSGFGNTEPISMLQTGILGGISLKFSGSLVIALPTGTCATTSRWPYDLLRAVRFTANGQTNLINVAGSALKAREIMARGDMSDRGVSRGVGGASPGTATVQGTLSAANENWGVGQNVTAIAAATYPVELEYYVPIAHDSVNLIGAIFAQTTSTDLLLQLDYANLADLFTLTGTATATLTGTWQVVPTLYSIPQGPNGDVIVPDLSVFHSLIQTRMSPPTNGDNEIRLTGQGVGRQLMRLWFRLLNNTNTVLPLNATNFGQLGWRYGSNDTPEIVSDGKHLAYIDERLFGNDMAQVAGLGIWDFVHENAFRDTVDMGAATELRLLINIPVGVTLTNPAIEYVQELVFPGAAA